MPTPTPHRLTSRQIDRLIPATGQLDTLVENVASARRRPITLMPVDTMPGEGVSGMFIATEDNDFIVFPKAAAAAPTHRDAIVCHELAHMLLGHESAASPEEARLMLIRLVAPSLDPSVATSILCRHEHTTADEADAEMLGTRLAVALVAASLAAASAPLARRLR